jgi:ABC-type branched-subunit amino acid transport system permease subunit
MHAAPVWLPMAACVVAAFALWFAIFNPRRKVTLWSLIVLVTMLAVAFAVGRWKPRGTIEIVPETSSRR